MNYCAACGFKIEGEFKFCPNCGNQIKIIGSSPIEVTEIEKDIIICKNCGEENPGDNSVCFSCGIPLNGNKRKNQASVKQDTKKHIQKNSGSKKSNNEEKVLDNKKILIISSVIIVIFIFALVVSGVFDSGVKTSVN